jgi:RNA polymerase sigma factor (TIGR02999 family)
MDTMSHQITQLLVEWGNGDKMALGKLMPLVYEELRQMAKGYMKKQYDGHTFQTTELIHEAYLKLAKKEEQNWKNRAHFFGVAAQAMRHILVDYARAKQRQKRGGTEALHITLEENAVISTGKSDEIIALDDALSALGKFDDRKMRVVELKFFGGLKIDEIAEVLSVSRDTVKNDWRFSKSWLLRELSNN